MNHFLITSFFVLHPTSRRFYYVYVGVSPFPSVLLFGAIQIIVLYLLFPFLNCCYVVTILFLPRIDCLLKFRQILSAILPWPTFLLPIDLSSALRKFVNLLLTSLSVSR